MYKDVHPFVNNFDPPGVELHCLYGYGIPTVEKWVEFWSAMALGCLNFKEVII